jgi:hypothetical protein
MFDRDARELARDIHSGAFEHHGLPKTPQFDRIDVSNIIDTEYVGIPNVLADWASLLSMTNRHSILLGYSMNWVPKEPDAQPGGRDMVMKRLTTQLFTMGKVSEIFIGVMGINDEKDQSQNAPGRRSRSTQVLHCDLRQLNRIS